MLEVNNEHVFGYGKTILEACANAAANSTDVVYQILGVWQMKVKLLYNTPLWVTSTAIRKCWASEDKSDTEEGELGPKDKELIHRVGNKFKHSSTLEHINYSFDIDGISRACLQELARHRMASLSVKSTRYTLKELKESTGTLEGFLVCTGDEMIDRHNHTWLHTVKEGLLSGKSNDKVKYMLPEAYKTSLVWTINLRSLQNFLKLRTNKSALWEIRGLAYAIYNALPPEHLYMVEEFVEWEK